MWFLIVGSIIGALTSIGTTVFVEYLRRPKLKISIEKNPFDRITPSGREYIGYYHLANDLSRADFCLHDASQNEMDLLMTEPT